MTTIDEAFIRAFGQQAGGPGAAPQPASGAQASDRPAEQRDDEGPGVLADSPCPYRTAEQAAEACPCSADGTCPCGSDGACPLLRAGRELPAAVDPAEAESPGVDPEGPPDEPFQPSFQVDGFAWPSGCTRLSMVAGEQIDRLADALADERDQGRRVVAMSGCRPGDGCTTLLLCLARRLAERGLRIAVIDADFDNPLLARRLGLLPEVGWEEIFTARLPVEEVTIESVQEGLAVLPLCGSVSGEAFPAGDHADPAARLDVLRERYDLVLVDLGPLGDDTLEGQGVLQAVLDWIDAMVLVHNVSATSEDELNRIRRRAQAAGLVEAGIAENFVEVRKSA